MSSVIYQDSGQENLTGQGRHCPDELYLSKMAFGQFVPERYFNRFK
jgi:hypothetical protein